MKKYFLPHKILISAVISILVSLGIPGLAFSQENASSETTEVDREIVEKILSTKMVSIRQIMKEAEKNLEKVNRDILQQREKESASDLIDEGKRLYASGQIEQAKQTWEKAAKISNDPSVRDHLNQMERVEREKSKILSQQNSAKNK